jgi:hypothetical protein
MIDNQNLIELTLMIIQIIILVGLFKIYYDNYKTVKMDFAIGLLLFTSILIVANVFSIITILTSQDFLPIVENLIELTGIAVLYYIARKY